MTGLTTHDFRSAIQTLGISGRVICLHSSLRSFGRVDAPTPIVAAHILITAFLDEGCTVIVPTFTRIFEMLPPESAMFIPNNGINLKMLNRLWYDYLFVVRHELKLPYYSADSQYVDIKDMGIIPATLLRMEGHVRGNHPLMSFAGIGEKAQAIISAQTPLDGYAPLRQLVEHEGVVGLLGVGYERMSLLHYAEQVAGRRLFTRWAIDEKGDAMAVGVGGCANGFGNFAPLLTPIAQVGIVGKSMWRIYDAKMVVDRASSAIRQNPRMTKCDDSDCLLCKDLLAQKLSLE